MRPFRIAVCRSDDLPTSFGFGEVFRHRPDVLPSSYRWSARFYAMMQAIRLKRQFELAHDVEYDVVMHCIGVAPVLPRRPQPYTLYVTQPPARRPDLFYGMTVADTVLYGDSRTMDVIGDLYRYYVGLWWPTNMRPSDQGKAWHYDSGQILYEYCGYSNINIEVG